MEIKAILKKPYTESQRTGFVVKYNHQMGYTIEETATELKALGYTEEEIELQEKERIAKLFLTGADVERGIYQAKGMDFDDIIAFVENTQKPSLDGEGAEGGWGDIDLKALKIELKANHFYRGNPYVNAVGALLGFTSEQLDKFFETNDYTYLIPEPVVDNPEKVKTETVENTELEGDEV